MSRLVRWLKATPLHPQWLIRNERRIFARAVAGATGTVLDVGCGDRWVERELAPGCSYVGLDSLATGRDCYGARPAVFADAAQLPIRSDALDAVLMLEVIEHLAEPFAALEEAWRCLRPGGRLVVSVPFLYPVHDAPHDFQRFTEHGLALALQRVGFGVTSLERRLPALEAAGLSACLAMGASAKLAMEKPGPGLLLVPVWAILVPLVNVGAAVLARVVPDWSAMTNGYVGVGVKPIAGDEAAEDVQRGG